MTVRDQIEARAKHAEFANRTFLMHDAVHWTYGRFRNESVRMAHFLLRHAGTAEGTGNVAIMLENNLELAALIGGCAYAKSILFGINTGLRGDVLAGVLNHSRARLLVVNTQFYPEVLRILDRLEHITQDRVLVVPSGDAVVEPERDLRQRLESELGPAVDTLEAPSIPVAPSDNLMVIYTSGTTGLPKGINNNNFKLLVTGLAVSNNMGLSRDDVGYICMPLF